MDNYFTCDPQNLCGKAECCHSIGTRPVLTVGDYMRLGQYTNKSAVEIWRENGDIALMDGVGDTASGKFIISLGLLHEPCPYLTDSLTCAVYEKRPVSCADFPLSEYEIEGEAAYKEFNLGCLKDIKLSLEQRDLSRKMREIMIEEEEIDLKHFWGGRRTYFNLSGTGEYFRIADNALAALEIKDPDEKLPRTQRVLASIEQMRHLVETKQTNGIHTNVVKQLLSPLIFTIGEDAIANRLGGIPQEVRELYDGTTKKLVELFSRRS